MPRASANGLVMSGLRHRGRCTRNTLSFVSSCGRRSSARVLMCQVVVDCAAVVFGETTGTGVEWPLWLGREERHFDHRDQHPHLLLQDGQDTLSRGALLLVNWVGSRFLTLCKPERRQNNIGKRGHLTPSTRPLPPRSLT